MVRDRVAATILGGLLLLTSLEAGCLFRDGGLIDSVSEPAPGTEEPAFVRRESGPLIFESRRDGIPPIRIEIPCRHEFESDSGKNYDLHYAYCVHDDGSVGESGLGIFVGESPVTFHDREKFFVDKDRREDGDREILWYRWEEKNDDGETVLMRETVLEDFFEEFFESRGEKAPRKSKNEDLHVWVFGPSSRGLAPLMAAVPGIEVAPEASMTLGEGNDKR